MLEKKEQSGIKSGRILIHSQDAKSERDIYYVWYRTKHKGKIKDKEQPRILAGTSSFSKEGAEEQKIRLIKSGIFKEYEFGVLCVKSRMDDFIFLKEIQEGDLEKIRPLGLKNYIVVDTETTGFQYSDEVIDLAAVKVIDNRVVGSFQKFIIPTKKINYYSQKVHGLTKEFLLKNGIPAHEAFKEFKSFIQDSKGPLQFVGHNVQFDKTKIEDHSKRVRVPINIPIAFDTQKMAEILIETPNYKLETLVDYFDFRNELKAHSALDDSIGTQRIASRLREIAISNKIIDMAKPH